MPTLIDTHTFLWLVSDDSQLTAAARSCLQDANNRLFLSVASGWEIAIKLSQGRKIDRALRKAAR